MQYAKTPILNSRQRIKEVDECEGMIIASNDIDISNLQITS